MAFPDFLIILSLLPILAVTGQWKAQYCYIFFIIIFEVSYHLFLPQPVCNKEPQGVDLYCD